MLRSLTRASVAACVLGWATPAAALECADYAELMDAGVVRSVVQKVVLESPPEDGWSCLDATPHAVSDLRMERAFRRLDPTEELSWQMRFKQCDAGRGLRRGTRRLFAEADAPPPPEPEPETPACRRAAALQEAILADTGA
mgnify:FL=1